MIGISDLSLEINEEFIVPAVKKFNDLYNDLQKDDTPKETVRQLFYRKSGEIQAYDNLTRYLESFDVSNNCRSVVLRFKDTTKEKPHFGRSVLILTNGNGICAISESIYKGKDEWLQLRWQATLPDDAVIGWTYITN